MDLAQLIVEARSRLRDQVQPYLWSDSELYSYIDGAQLKYFELAGWINDKTSSLTRVSLRAGTSAIRRDPRVVKIMSAYLSTARRKLNVVSHIAKEPWEVLPGTPTELSTFDDDSYFLLDSVMQTDDVLLLNIEREPLETVAAGEELEVPPRHHQHLLLWVEHLAYMRPDTETEDTYRASRAGELFEELCYKQLRGERDRTRVVSGTVAYGGY